MLLLHPMAASIRMISQADRMPGQNASTANLHDARAYFREA
jgi:hypothetical protein